ncbi:MAG: cysteine-rich repeat protein, partial [Bradymonadia bacterium]
PGDTELMLLSADGNIVINDSDLSGGLCAGLAETLPAGDYTVMISGAAGQAVGAYFLDATFEFERLPGEPCDPEGVLNRCAAPAECRGEPALCRIGDCGDGVQDVGEACDDNNLVNGDGCDAQCRVEACGNGVVDAGEGCDDGNNIDGDDCDASCVSELVCGDGDIDAGEDCDDGNLVDGDGCNAACVREPACGDGILDAGEDCDDGNIIDGDRCDANCAIEPACGDGTLDAGEGCDDGNNIDGDRCDANCAIEPFCGDGILDADEECDDGNNRGADGCDPLCVREPRCGDAVVDPNEECDDGNLINGDGCDVVCTLEGPDSDPACGDGDVDPATENCDDGNLLDGDGCDSLCTFEVINVNTAFAQLFGAFAAQNGDTFRFTVESTATLFATTDNGAGVCPGGVDTFFTVNRLDVPDDVATNDDGGDGLCSALELLLEPGEYELVVTGFGDAAVAGYVLNFQLIADVSAGGAFAGGFTANGDDGFLLTIAAETDARIATGDGAGGCPGDTQIVLYAVDAQGQLALIDTVADGGVGACAAIDQAFAAGTYLMFVQGVDGVAIPGYVLDVERGACGDGVVEGAEACDDGNAINGDGCDTACTLEDFDLINAESLAVESVPVGGVDTYSFIVDDESYLFAATDGPQGGCPGDTLLVLYSINAGVRVEVGRDDDGGDGGCSVLQNNALPAGTYELDVSAAIELTYRLVVFHTVLISQLGDYAGALVAGGDDNFSFSLNMPTSLSIRTGGARRCPDDTVMLIYSVDANGARALVVENDDGGDGLCSLVAQEFPAGDYEIVVVGYSNNAVAPYVLSFDLL